MQGNDHNLNRVILIIELMVILGGCLSEVTPPSPVGQNIGQPMPAAAVNVPQGFRAGDSRLYPDASLTPGAVMTTNTTILCVSGYTTTVRNVTDKMKKQVYTEYGLNSSQPRGAYEVDHFIPLVLGGSNDISNLWPEPANPKPGFHEKDVVENYLHKKVCSGAMNITDAQQAIRVDWYAVYLQMKGLSLTTTYDEEGNA